MLSAKHTQLLAIRLNSLTVNIKEPRICNIEYTIEVNTKNKQYEVSNKDDLNTMFLAGMITRTLLFISERLLDKGTRVVIAYVNVTIPTGRGFYKQLKLFFPKKVIFLLGA